MRTFRLEQTHYIFRSSVHWVLSATLSHFVIVTAQQGGYRPHLPDGDSELWQTDVPVVPKPGTRTVV